MARAKVKNDENKGLKRSLIRKNIDLYIILLPALIYLILFKYVPMRGLTMAFQDYNIFKGMSGSEWVGLENFRRLFTYDEFWRVLKNTLLISTYKLMLFPIPVFVAILLNEVRNSFAKRTIQTIIYFPHFLSWIVISGIFLNILSTSGGLVNELLGHLGIDPIPFMYDNRYFRGVLVFAHSWKGTGWNTITYIAAIAGIDQSLYEAAKVDGAGRLKQIFYITIPSLMPTMVMIFVLNLGHILDAGTEQVLAMYNSLVYETGDIIGTYVYRMGLGKMEYGFSTAVGMFNSVVGFILVMSGNWLSRRLNERSIW